jgi:hypothetical protein
MMDYEFTQEMIDAANKAEAKWREDGQPGPMWKAVFEAMLAEAEKPKTKSAARSTKKE